MHLIKSACMQNKVLFIRQIKINIFFEFNEKSPLKPKIIESENEIKISLSRIYCIRNRVN